MYDGAAVPEELIDLRFAASIDPEVVADPPLRRPSGPLALRTLWRMDLTRDGRLKSLQTPTLVLWGRDDKVNRPAGGPMLLNTMPNAELVMTSRTGHWMQWERAELFNQLVTEFLSPNRYQAIICLGAVIRGETTHDQHINRSVSHAITRLSIDANIPVLFGVLTCETMEQAIHRAGGNVGNKGAEAAEAALQMVGLLKNIP